MEGWSNSHTGWTKAHLSMTQGRPIQKFRLGGHLSATLFIAVDGRARMNSNLVTKTLQHTVEVINRAVNRIDDAYFKSLLEAAPGCHQLGELGAVEKERPVPTADTQEMVLTPNIEDSRWTAGCRSRSGSWTLAAGCPCSPFLVLPAGGGPAHPASFFRDGSVDAHNRDMDTFKSCCYSMDD
ncbi:putative transferase family protein [Panicum miliaceum]|uniref:Transferase family protein n=1 Tax=Panicum miliaceum TaxID=4540 RepID=A0A3L6PBM3_PANMI|nr:putative transferase family protein [Panicum miliaceum]